MMHYQTYDKLFHIFALSKNNKRKSSLQFHRNGFVFVKLRGVNRASLSLPSLLVLGHDHKHIEGVTFVLY